VRHVMRCASDALFGEAGRVAWFLENLKEPLLYDEQTAQEDNVRLSGERGVTCVKYRFYENVDSIQLKSCMIAWRRPGEAWQRRFVALPAAQQNEVDRSGLFLNAPFGTNMCT
jgi:hypothetical protein